MDGLGNPINVHVRLLSSPLIIQRFWSPIPVILVTLAGTVSINTSQVVSLAVIRY